MLKEGFALKRNLIGAIRGLLPSQGGTSTPSFGVKPSSTSAGRLQDAFDGSH